MGKMQLTAEPGRHDYTVTKVIDAPVETVFNTYVDPKLTAEFWQMEVDTMDPRPGGSWRYAQRDEAGNEEHAFRGVYHEVSAPNRIVHTFEYEGMPGHISLETITFTEQGGGTLMTDHVVFQSVESRDGMIGSGMEKGMSELLDRLEKLASEGA